MQYLLGQFSLWLAVALVLGLIIGFWAARRTSGYSRADGRLWAGLYVALLLVGAGIAAVRTVKGLNGLWFDTLVLFAAAYLIGCLAGAVLGGRGQSAGHGTAS